MGDNVDAEQDEAISRYDVLFPQAICQATAGELSAWTSVQDIAAAARCLAKVPIDGDVFDSRLAIPFPDDDVLQAIILEVIGWLISAYHVPESKIRLAATVEPCLSNDIHTIIAGASFRSTVSVGPTGALIHFAPALAQDPSDRFLLVEDEPYVIELVQGPLRAMMGLIRQVYSTAKSAGEMKAQGAAAGSPPTIFHRPFADSRLPAVIEALAFYACGLDFGPHWATGMAFDHSYKAVNVQGQPPFDAVMLDGARELTAKLLDSLT